MISGQQIITAWSEPPPPWYLVRRSPGMLEGIIATGHTPPSVTDWLDWLTQRGLAPTTKVGYRRVMTLLNAWLAMRGHDVGADGDALITATKDDLTVWRESLGYLSTGSVLTYLAPVRTYYSWVCTKGLRPDDPTDGLPLPKQPRRLPRPIADDPLEDAIAGARPRVRIILILAAYAGLRACEIARLRREDILNTADSPVLLITGKGSHERTVPLGMYVWSELCTWGLPRRGYIVPRMDAQIGPCKPQLISKIANDYLHAGGIEETLHQLRHRFGTSAYGASHDLRVVQELMGHQSPSTTAGYAAFSNTAAAGAVAAIEPSRRLRGLDGGASQT